MCPTDDISAHFKVFALLIHVLIVIYSNHWSLYSRVALLS